jgi:hypothetical protein
MIKTQINTPDRAKRRTKKRDDNRPRPRFGSIEDASEYLGISRAHFYLYALPRVRSFRLGRRHLIDLDSLDQLADELSAAE